MSLSHSRVSPVHIDDSATVAENGDCCRISVTVADIRRQIVGDMATIEIVKYCFQCGQGFKAQTPLLRKGKVVRHVATILYMQITGVMTQGRSNGLEWVTSFMMSYSVQDAFHWQYVRDIYDNQRVIT